MPRTLHAQGSSTRAERRELAGTLGSAQKQPGGLPPHAGTLVQIRPHLRLTATEHICDLPSIHDPCSCRSGGHSTPSVGKMRRAARPRRRRREGREGQCECDRNDFSHGTSPAFSHATDLCSGTTWGAAGCYDPCPALTVGACGNNSKGKKRLGKAKASFSHSSLKREEVCMRQVRSTRIVSELLPMAGLAPVGKLAVGSRIHRR